MAVCWLLCAAVFSYLLSAERVADQRLLREADSFLTRRHRARESEQQEKRTKAPLAAHGVQDGTRADVKVGLPECSDGILQLDGVYEVKKEEVVVAEGSSCRVTGSAELLLSAPVRFAGSAVFAGRLSVKAAVGDGGRINGSCLAVEGNLTLHPEALLSLQGCKNEAKGDAGTGGCLHVGGDAELRGGQLLLHDCNASNRHGGGIFVGGRVQSRNATIVAEGCQANHGGAIFAESDMIVSGGNVTIKGSTAHYDGGAIFAESDMIVSGGNVTIKGSTAHYDGGAILAKNNVIVSGGNVTIKGSDGGAILAKNNVIVSGGSVNIKESEADYGGAIYAPGLAISGGNVNIKESMASETGGAIYAHGLAISGGNVNIEESEARMDGGGVYAKHMNVSGGNVTIKECKAGKNAGAIHADNVTVSGGNLTIKESTSQHGYGGAIRADSHMAISGGNVTINGSTAHWNGGAIYARNMAISGGNLTIKESKVNAKGGAIHVDNMTVSGGNLTIKESRNQYGDGGAIYATSAVAISGGNVSIEGSKAGKSGGSIHAPNMAIADGNLNINTSESRVDGGSIHAPNMTISGGNVTVEESEAHMHGGSIYATNMAISGGSVVIKESLAFRNAGAIHATDTINVAGGNVVIKGSAAEADGGAIHARSMNVTAGSLTINRSVADSNGGCILTVYTFTQSGGAVSLQGCRAKREGGGIFSRGNITMEDAATLTIRDSQADRGGGVIANWVSNKAMRLHVFNCSATSHGGCFYVEAGAEFAAPLHLRSCNAEGTGGAIYAQGILLGRQQINCSHCNAPTAGCLQLESGEAHIDTMTAMTLQSSSSLLPASSTVAAGANANVTLGRMDCRQVPGCTLAVAKMQLAQLLCQRGESRQSLADGDGAACRECPTGEIRLVAVDKEDARCTPCPSMGNVTVGCTSTELRVPPGYMVDFDRDAATNLSAWYRCPNEMACRGGHFNASSVPGERAQELVPMCEEGYRGPGCTSCTAGHARADADILWCIPCATWTTSPKQVVWYVSFFLLKNLALFVSAVVSVEGSAGKRAASATLLNQAMSFAAVAGVTMSGAMQTGTFKNDLDNAAQVALHMLALPTSVAQGQGSGDGGSSSMSGQCLLQLLNMDSSIHNVHMLMSLWPALLVAGLAVLKGGWLAAVVGSNVFLPAFIAGFGKYLVAFRLRPESENEALHLDFLPPGPQMSCHVPLRVAAVLGAIVGFSALSVCSWIYAVRTRSPKETRPHVAYLIQAYRPECAIWEVERLMRKVLLALVATVLPVTLSPALQMEAVTLVLIASLVAHLYFWPYEADDWNRAEIGLLIVSLTITGMTTCLIANDLHWAKSALTQRLLVFLICAIAGGICIAMMVAFAMAYLAERRQRAEAKKAEESAARPLPSTGEAAAEPRADATRTLDD